MGNKGFMYHFGLVGKKKLSCSIDLALRFQLDGYASAEKLTQQEVIARAVKFAHPRLATKSGSVATYAHLRRKKVDVVERAVITPKLSEETLNEVEDIKRWRGLSPGQIVAWSLKLFFEAKEKEAAGRLDQQSLTTYCAPDYDLAKLKFSAPWIASAPAYPQIERDTNLVPNRFRGRTVYVGADFLLTMMTSLEDKYAPRSRMTRGSRDILLAAAEGTFNLMTSALDLLRLASFGGALREARDEAHFKTLLTSVRDLEALPTSGSPLMVGRLECLRKLGIRIIPTDIEDVSGICKFLRTSSDKSVATLIGLNTLNHVSPGSAVMLRFLKGEDHPAMMVWQEYCEEGKLIRMSSRDAKRG